LGLTMKHSNKPMKFPHSIGKSIGKSQFLENKEQLTHQRRFKYKVKNKSKRRLLVEERQLLNQIY